MSASKMSVLLDLQTPFCVIRSPLIKFSTSFVREPRWREELLDSVQLGWITAGYELGNPTILSYQHLIHPHFWYIFLPFYLCSVCKITPIIRNIYWLLQIIQHLVLTKRHSESAVWRITALEPPALCIMPPHRCTNHLFTPNQRCLKT